MRCTDTDTEDYEPNPEPETPSACVRAMDTTAARVEAAEHIIDFMGAGMKHSHKEVIKRNIREDTRDCWTAVPAPQSCLNAIRAATRIAGLARDTYREYTRTCRTPARTTGRCCLSREGSSEKPSRRVEMVQGSRWAAAQGWSTVDRNAETVLRVSARVGLVAERVGSA